MLKNYFAIITFFIIVLVSCKKSVNEVINIDNPENYKSLVSPPNDLNSNIVDVVMDSNFFNALEPVDEEFNFAKISKNQDMGFSKIKIKHLDPKSPLTKYADDNGEVTVMYTLDDIELLSDIDASYLDQIDKNSPSFSLSRKKINPAISQDITRMKSIEQINKDVKWLNQRKNDYLTEKHIGKKRLIEVLAKPLEQDLVLYRFLDKRVAEQQLKQGNFSNADYNYYFNQYPPGTYYGRRAGRGVYAIKPELLYRVGNLAELSLKRAGVGVKPGDAAGLLRIVIQKGNKHIDFKDPKVRRALRSHNISYEDITYLDPNITMRFHEFPHHDFWIIKDLTNQNIKIEKPNPEDFSGLTVNQARKFIKNGKELKEHFYRIAPESVRKFRLKEGLFTRFGKLIFKPLIVVKRKIEKRLADIYYMFMHLRQLRIRESSVLANVKKRNDILFQLSFMNQIGKVKYIDSNFEDYKPSSNFEAILTAKSAKELQKNFPAPKYTLNYTLLKHDRFNDLYTQFNVPRHTDLYFVTINRDPIARKGREFQFPSNQKFEELTNYHKLYYTNHYSKEYALQNRTTSVEINGKTYTSTRPNHGLSHGVRSGYLAADAVMLINRHLGATDIGKFVNKKIAEDPHFVEKIQHYAILNRAARIGEATDTDASGTISRNILNFYNDPLTNRLFSPAEKIAYSRAFYSIASARSGEKLGEFIENSLKNASVEEKNLIESLDLKTNLNAEEKYIGAITYLGHFNDHRRMKFWNRDISYSEQMELLNYAGIDNTSADKLIKTLWTRSGHYLRVTGAGDSDIYRHLGSSDSEWDYIYGSLNNRYLVKSPRYVFDNRYRHIRDEELFFQMETNPELLFERLSRTQRSMNYDAFLDEFIEDVTYLLPSRINSGS